MKKLILTLVLIAISNFALAEPGPANDPTITVKQREAICKGIDDNYSGKLPTVSETEEFEHGWQFCRAEATMMKVDDYYSLFVPLGNQKKLACTVRLQEGSTPFAKKVTCKEVEKKEPKKN